MKECRSMSGVLLIVMERAWSHEGKPADMVATHE